MKDKDIFEKARMRTVIIPIAGFITAAATVLLVIFSAAYFGAFNVMKETTATRAPEFDPPEEPDMSFYIPVVDMNPSVYLKLTTVEFRTSNGTVRFKVRLKNETDTKAHVDHVRCVMYKDGQSIISYVLGSDFNIDPHSDIIVSGSERIGDADSVLFDALWRDPEGRAASGYIVAGKNERIK